MASQHTRAVLRPSCAHTEPYKDCRPHQTSTEAQQSERWLASSRGAPFRHVSAVDSARLLQAGEVAAISYILPVVVESADVTGQCQDHGQGCRSAIRDRIQQCIVFPASQQLDNPV